MVVRVLAAALGAEGQEQLTLRQTLEKLSHLLEEEPVGIIRGLLMLEGREWPDSAAALLAALDSIALGGPASARLCVRSEGCHGIVPRRELVELARSLMESAASHAVRVVVFAGPRGSGKTTLGEIFRAEAQARGASFGRLLCLQSAGSVEVGQEAEPDPQALVHSLCEGGIESPDDCLDRHRTLVLFADDLDSLGQTGLSRFFELVQRAARWERPVIFVGACEHVPTALQNWCRQASSLALLSEDLGSAPSPEIEIYSIPRMAPPELRALAAELTCCGASPALAEVLETRTGGDPLLAVEMIGSACRRRLLTRGPSGLEIAGDSSELGPVPAAVTALIGEEFAGLESIERQLALLASLGPGVTLSVAASVLAIEMEEAASACASLESKGVLKHSGDRSGLVLRHEVLRKYAYESVPSAELRRLHGAVARVCEERCDEESGADNVDEIIAWHRSRSDLPQTALGPALVAARRFERERLVDRAVEYFWIAETAAAAAHFATWDDSGPLREVADAYWRLGRAPDCARALRTCLSLVERLGDVAPTDILSLKWKLGRALTIGGDSDSAMKLLEGAVDMAHQLDDPCWISRVYCSKAAVHQMRGEFREIDLLADSSIGLLSTCDDPALLSRACNVKGNAKHALCDWTEAVSWYGRSAEYAMKVGDTRLVGGALCNQGLAWLLLGDWHEAGQCFARARELAESSAHAYGIEMVGLNEGTLRQRMGALRDAAGCYCMAAHAARECGDNWGLALSLSNLGELEFLRGSIGSALQLYEESERLMSSIGSVDDLPELLRRKALALSHRREPTEAYALLQRARSMAEDMSNRLEQANCDRAVGDFQIRVGRSSDAERSYMRSEELSSELGAPYENALALSGVGAARLAMASWDRAAIPLADALESLLRLGARRDAHQVQRLLAGALGRADSASERLPRNRDALGSLLKSSKGMASATTARELLSEVADAAAAGVAAEAVASVLRMDDGEVCVVPTSLLETPSDESIDGVVQTLMVDLRANSTDPLVHSSSDSSDPASALLQDRGITRAMLIPICSKHKVLGAIYADYRTRDVAFPEQDVRFLQALAAQAAVAIENVILRAELEDEVEYLRWEVDGRSSFSNIIGRSLEMQKLFTLLQKVSRTSVTVLIEGESGTGKELVARAIHFNSPRKSERFLAQNCAALPDQLLESELFGHVRGAFTGAMREKAGLFEAVDGGTFFLDEIADMPVSLQVKLLRVLQDGEVRRVGAMEPMSVDVRIVAATNKDLEAEVRAGRFREDLFYRLNVIRIKMPALRDRRDDIPLLAQHFLDKYAEDLGDPPRGFSDDAMNLLVNYDWPGNVRELENEIQRAIALAKPGSVIIPSLLSERIRDVDVVVQPIRPGAKLSLKDMVEDVEKRVIMQVLTENKWNKSRAAKLLGLSRQGLLKKIARFGLKPIED